MKDCKLRKIIKCFDGSIPVIIYQEDVYVGKDDNSEKIYEGPIYNIPWVYLDYYITHNHESIYLTDVKGKTILVFYVNKERLSER